MSAWVCMCVCSLAVFRLTLACLFGAAPQSRSSGVSTSAPSASRFFSPRFCGAGPRLFFLSAYFAASGTALAKAEADGARGSTTDAAAADAALMARRRVACSAAVRESVARSSSRCILIAAVTSTTAIVSA